MQGNVERLLDNLDSSAYLLTKLAERSFLKLYLHADETQRQIDNATDDLMDIIMIFQVSSRQCHPIPGLIPDPISYILRGLAGRVEDRPPA